MKYTNCIRHIVFFLLFKLVSQSLFASTEPCRTAFQEVGIEIPEIDFVIEGAGDVVERFYIEAFANVRDEREGKRKVNVTFTDFSSSKDSLEQTAKRQRIREKIEAAGFVYLDKAKAEDLARYKKLSPEYVVLAIPPFLQGNSVRDWQAAGLPPIRIFAEKPLEGSLKAARALAAGLDPRSDFVMAMDHYRPKLAIKPEDVPEIEKFMGGLDRFEVYTTEDRSGSDKSAAIVGDNGRDGAIEREGRSAMLKEGVGADYLSHDFAILEYFANVNTMKAESVRAGRYKGVDGDPEKETDIPNETYFAADVAVDDNHGKPVSGKIVVGKGVRVKKYGAETEGNTKILELVGKNGNRVVFDLRRSGQGASTVSYFTKEGVLERSGPLEALPYKALFAGMADGRSATNGLALSVKHGVTFREKLAELTSAARKAEKLPVYEGGMGGEKYRLAPYAEELWDRLPELLNDRDFLMIGGTGVMGKGYSHRITQVAGNSLVISDPSSNAREVMKTLGPDADVILAKGLKEAVQNLKKPRRMMLLVTNDRVTQLILDQLKNLLEPGDVIIDGGNNNWVNTQRRQEELGAKGIHLIGMGVSGGERGAWNGSSMMPGGNEEAWKLVQPILEAIAAKVPHISDPKVQTPSVSYIGPGGSGHFVKMTHNGIEYVEMQLLAETYDLLRKLVGMPNSDMKKLFTGWNKSELKSFLLGATATVINHPDAKTGRPLVELIKAVAAQKGTGKWAAENALDFGGFAPTLAEAVFARNATGFGSQFSAYQELQGPKSRPLKPKTKAKLLRDLPKALYAAKILDFAQGFHLIELASKEKFNGQVNFAGLSNTWRTGSILQGAMLDVMTREFSNHPSYAGPIDSPVLRTKLSEYQQALRDVVGMARTQGVPVPAMSSLLSYYDTLRAQQLPANLIQAMRDYFGGHTFERIDESGVHHSDWGEVTSGAK